MLKLWRKKEHAIGIDLGGSSLKMMQLGAGADGLELLAAAKVYVPPELSADAAALQRWCIENIKEQLTWKPFKGKKVVSSLPTRDMLVLHLRVPKVDEQQLAKILRWEVQDKVPFDVNSALLRHVVAGEVYEGDEPKLEVIVMAAPHQAVQRHLNLLERIKLEIDAIDVEPQALINCFAHLLGQDEEQDKATMFVDLAYGATKVVVTHGTEMAFCRTVNIGAEQIRRALSEHTGVESTDAAKLHRGYGNSPQVTENSGSNDTEQAPPPNTETSGACATAAVAQAHVSETDQTAKAAEVIEGALQDLCEEIRSCVRYHDLTFSTQPVGKAIFLGGQAKNKSLCQKVAQGLRLPAQLGDPLARINLKNSSWDQSELDDQVNSDWSVAFGLSLKS